MSLVRYVPSAETIMSNIRPLTATALTVYNAANQAPTLMQFVTNYVADDIILQNSTSWTVRHWLRVIISFAYLYMFLHRIHKHRHNTEVWSRRHWALRTVLYFMAFVHWMSKAHGHSLYDLSEKACKAIKWC